MCCPFHWKPVWKKKQPNNFVRKMSDSFFFCLISKIHRENYEQTAGNQFKLVKEQQQTDTDPWWTSLRTALRPVQSRVVGGTVAPPCGTTGEPHNGTLKVSFTVLSTKDLWRPEDQTGQKEERLPLQTHPLCFMLGGLSMRTASLIFRSTSWLFLGITIRWNSACLGPFAVGFRTTWSRGQKDDG